MLFMLLYCCYL